MRVVSEGRRGWLWSREEIRQSSASLAWRGVGSCGGRRLTPAILVPRGTTSRVAWVWSYSTSSPASEAAAMRVPPALLERAVMLPDGPCDRLVIIQHNMSQDMTSTTAYPPGNGTHLKCRDGLPNPILLHNPQLASTGYHHTLPPLFAFPKRTHHPDLPTTAGRGTHLPDSSPAGIILPHNTARGGEHECVPRRRGCPCERMSSCRKTRRERERGVGGRLM
jgi:hypothetical protein